MGRSISVRQDNATLRRVLRSPAAAERLFGVVKTTVLRVSASKKLVATELVLKDHSIFSRKLFLK
jgi:hypothetical protein